MRSTRNCGRQSKSRQTTRRPGRCRVITVATESTKPRTALTGRPSGEVIDDGTPKNERNHMLAPSSSTRGPGMSSSCHCGWGRLPELVSRFPSEVYARRLHEASNATAAARLAGLIVTPGYDLRYLIGSRAQTFERLTALVLPVGRAPTIVVPRLELASLNESAVGELGLAVRDWTDGEDPYK